MKMFDVAPHIKEIEDINIYLPKEFIDVLITF